MLQAPTSDRKNKAEASSKTAESLAEQESQALPSLMGRSRKSHPLQQRSSLSALQKTYGNQAVLRMSREEKVRSSPAANPMQGVLQRKCACGNSAGSSGSCAECQSKQEGILQTKLQIGAAGDRYEQEADLVAAQVMRMSEPSVQRQGEPEAEDEVGMVKRKAIANSITPLKSTSANHNQSFEVPPIVDEVLRSPGQSLDLVTRALMEPRFGHDFSQVRIHTGGVAAQSASEVNAHAYTVGKNIVFGEGQYEPSTEEGRKLVAHELVHVLQQSGAGWQNSSTCLQRQHPSSSRTERRRALRSRDVASVGVGRAFVQFEVRDPDAARLLVELEGLFSLLAIRLERLIDEHAIRNSDAVDIYERWLNNASRQREQMVDGYPSFSPRRIFLWVTAIRNALHGQNRIIRAFREEVPDDQAFQEVFQLRTQAANLATDVLRLPIVQAGRAEETRTEESPASPSTAVHGESDPESLFRRAYEELRSYVRNNWHTIQRHEANDLVARVQVLEILRRFFGTDQEGLAEFFQYLRETNPELLNVVLFNGQTAYAFAGERPSLARVVGSIVEGVVFGDLRDIYRDPPSERSEANDVPSESEPLVEFGATDVAEEVSLESTTTEGGVLVGAIVVGLIPIVGQVADVRDFGANSYLLYTRPVEQDSWQRWLALAGSLLGLLPLIGDGLKYVSRIIMSSRRGFRVVARFDNLIQRLIRPLGDGITEGITNVQQLVRNTWQSHVVEPFLRRWESVRPYIENFAESVLRVSSDVIARIRSTARRMFPELLEQLRTRLDQIITELFEGAQAIGRFATRRLAEIQLLKSRVRSLFGRISPTQRMLNAFSEVEEAETVARRLLEDGGEASVRLAQEVLAEAESRIDEIMREAVLISRGEGSAVTGTSAALRTTEASTGSRAVATTGEPVTRETGNISPAAQGASDVTHEGAARSAGGTADEARSVARVSDEAGAPPVGERIASGTPELRGLPPEDLGRVGPVNRETARFFREHPNRLHAWAQHPTAAEALKFCTSPCWPENLTPAQIKRLDKFVLRARAEGIRFDRRPLHDALEAANELQVDVDDLIQGMEGRLNPHPMIDRADHEMLSGRSEDSLLGGEPDPALALRDQIIGRPSEAQFSGDLGEGLEVAASGATRMPDTYARRFSRKFREDLRRIFTEFDRDALRVFVRRMQLNGRSLRQVEIPTGAGLRRVDRLFVEGEQIVLREVKRYPNSTLRRTNPITQELEKDLAILDRFGEARVDWYIDGNISTDFLRELRMLQVERPGKFTIIPGPLFNPI